MGHKKQWIIGTAAVAVLIVCGTLLWKTAKDNKIDSKAEMKTESAAEENTKNTAMYISYGKGNYILADQENGTIFTVTMPEDLVDAAGNQITEKDLKTGNILTIYGNGIMMDSYPGQYPGVTRIEVASEGNPSDAEQYQSLIDQIYQEPDPSERPALNVEYRTKDAVISSVTTAGAYEWNYTDENGKDQSVVADTAHITEWSEIVDLNLEESTELTLSFSAEPKNIRIQRWSSQITENSDENAEIPEGEEVSAEESDGNYIIKNAQPGYRYLVSADWENGSTEYGFLTR